MRYLKLYLVLAIIVCTNVLLANNLAQPDLMKEIKAKNVKGVTVSSKKITGKTSGKVSEKAKAKGNDAKSAAKDNTSKSAAKNETKENSSKTMYVGVYSYLNVRSEPWGEIIGSLYNNDKVNVVKTEGDWYYIDSPMVGYVHSSYVFDATDKRYSHDVDEPATSDGSSSNQNVASNGSGNNTAVVTPAASGSSQQAIVDKANEFLETYSYSGSYPYRPETGGGVNGCAQVVSECLAQAGVNIPTILNTDVLMDYLKDEGWVEVDVPPYEAGDVIGWTIGGEENAHVGILIESGGNSACVMHNSSSRLHPSTMPADYYDVYKVVRKRG